MKGPRIVSEGSAARTAAAKSAYRKLGDSTAGSAATKAEAGAAADSVMSSSAQWHNLACGKNCIGWCSYTIL